jgi:hypothetical protein
MPISTHSMSGSWPKESATQKMEDSPRRNREFTRKMGIHQETWRITIWIHQEKMEDQQPSKRIGWSNFWSSSIGPSSQRKPKGNPLVVKHPETWQWAICTITHFKMFPWLIFTGVKQCHKPPMTGNGLYNLFMVIWEMLHSHLDDVAGLGDQARLAVVFLRTGESIKECWTMVDHMVDSFCTV